MNFMNSRIPAERLALIQELLDAGKTYREIASRLNVSPAAVYFAVERHGLRKTRKRLTEPPPIVNQIKEVMERGLSSVNIARELGCTPQTVFKHIKRWKLRPIKRRGRPQGPSKADVIQRMLDEGKLYREIGESLGLSKQRIHQIIRQHNLQVPPKLARAPKTPRPSSRKRPSKKLQRIAERFRDDPYIVREIERLQNR